MSLFEISKFQSMRFELSGTPSTIEPPFTPSLVSSRLLYVQVLYIYPNLATLVFSRHLLSTFHSFHTSLHIQPHIRFIFSKMVHFLKSLGLGLSAVALVAAVPTPTAAPDIRNAAGLQKRASCTFTDAAAVSKSKTSCATIVLNNIAVPSGTTLDLTKLTTGTHVRSIYLFSFEINTNSPIRLSLRGKPHLVMKNGLALLFPYPVLTLLSLDQKAIRSTETVQDGGMEREPMAERPSQSSSMPIA